MTTYKYTRTLVDGCYDIDACDKDPLFKAIQLDVTIPTTFTMHGVGAEVDITFDGDLTAEEEAALATVVADYK